MNNHPTRPPHNRDSARSKAQSHFEVADARTTLVKKMMDDERRAVDAKTAKLRAQRLAKEEEERLRAANNPVPQRGRAKTKPAAK